MPSDAEIDALIERIQEATRDIETGERLHEGVFAHVTVEDAEQAAAFLAALRDERDRLQSENFTLYHIGEAEGAEISLLRNRVRELEQALENYARATLAAIGPWE